MASPPKTSATWVVSRRGEPTDALELKQIPAPTLTSPTDILIKIAYAGLNHADGHIMGMIPPWLPIRRQPSTGMDFSGTIVAAGPGVSTLAVGDDVCGALSVRDIVAGKGALSEYLVIAAEQVSKSPVKADARQAASLGIAGQTAVYMLDRAEGRIRPGTTVLINGAASLLGLMLAQIAIGKGATVVGVCSGNKAEFVKAAGVAETIDYQQGNLEEKLAARFKTAPAVVAFDCVAYSTLYHACPSFLSPEGIFINCVSMSMLGTLYDMVTRVWLPGPLRLGPRAYYTTTLSPSGLLQRQVVDLVNDGTIHHIPIDSEYPRDSVKDAFAKLLTKKCKGKVVVSMGA